MNYGLYSPPIAPYLFVRSGLKSIDDIKYVSKTSGKSFYSLLAPRLKH